ncbi:MAG: hypothetical protein CMP36_01160 [Rickettsiales bacterium]|nr:hypothetical protein [Rickettsiales bacterium]OUV82482.1 MAG: hypothetical protein CBC91_01580 [Rickettsiales bacterium TMED131]|tara:strand:- start:1573 stop:2214 length:642 start_codon:yes stop_codon:yes gene_type:complete
MLDNDQILYPLPTILKNRFKKWKYSLSKLNKQKFRTLYSKGQSPKTFLVTCCDSRINALDFFCSEPGEFFVQRNIASLIPEKNSKNKMCSSGAALEYAVLNLKVKNIIVVGHSNCGGVKAYCDNAIEKNNTLNISNWLDILKPLNKIIKNTNNYELIEKEAVLLSVKNILSYDFVKKAVKKKDVNIYALWFNIKNCEMQIYNHNKNKFISLKV